MPLIVGYTLVSTYPNSMFSLLPQETSAETRLPTTTCGCARVCRLIRLDSAALVRRTSLEKDREREREPMRERVRLKLLTNELR